MNRRFLVVPVASMVLFAACGGGGSDAAGGHEHGPGGDHAHKSSGSVPGMPADSADADREIEVTTSDALSFEPDSIPVKQGEVVTFVITNEGEAVHEFVLGDEAYQQAHEDDMHSGMDHADNAVTIEPGKTKSLTWEFTDAGEVLYGCHVPGHYEGGMVGTIEVG